MPAIYIHWPFCLSKCPYCDFNSHVGDSQNQERWRQAYRRELEHYASTVEDKTVTSIFFGGGTPSLMEEKTVASVLNDIGRFWKLQTDAEITLEANPSSAEALKFAAFRNAGVNRLSLGVQAMNDKALALLGRIHNAAEAKAALKLVASIFDRYSFDLIYGYAGQTREVWAEELREALSYAKSHVSLYQLTIEPHTQYFTRDKKGEVLKVGEDEEIALFETTQETLNKAGLPAYEISNHAAKGHECRHNLTYWRYQDYIGIGPGAHGRVHQNNERHAIENHRAPDTWMKQVERLNHGVKNDEILTQETAMREALMMGLRLTEGINIQRWENMFPSPLLAFLPSEKRARLESEGLLEKNETALRATRAGLQRLNGILGYLLS